MGTRDHYTKVFRCAGCGAVARGKLSEDHRRVGDSQNPGRAIVAVEGDFTARMKDERTLTVHCNTCGSDKDH
jgi:hypothetical protein